MARQNLRAEQDSEQSQAPPGLDPEKARALADDLVAWMQQITLTEAEAYLDARKAALLTGEGTFVMGLLVRANPSNPIVRDHQHLLARAQEMGVQTLYAEIRRNLYV